MKTSLLSALIAIFIANTCHAGFSDSILAKYHQFDIDVSQILLKRSSTDFSAFSEVKRSSAASLYQRALPSVVKVLTNDGSGTGVIISNQDNGYLITNHHVIDGYRQVGLVFGHDQNNEKVTLGSVVKFDQIKDLALIAIDTKVPGLVPIERSSSGINIGDDVHAIGHPLGNDWTYTRGYVSQIRKKHAWQSKLGVSHVADVIQTQTPINPGNSGGPLLNASGQLVGINSFGDTSAQGINFAIKNDSVEEFLSSSGSVSSKKIDPRFQQDLIRTLDQNKNGVIDGYVWDTNQNKVADLFGEDLDENDDIETYLFDDNENQKIERILIYQIFEGRMVAFMKIDEGEDGTFETGAIDVDLDGNFDEIFPLKE